MEDARSDSARRLRERRDRGEYLLHSARMVGDEEDHAIWRRGCREWSRSVDELTHELFPDRHDELFPDRHADGLAAPADPDGSWKRRYEAELGAVRSGLALLVELEDELAREAAPSHETDAG